MCGAQQLDHPAGSSRHIQKSFSSDNLSKLFIITIIEKLIKANKKVNIYKKNIRDLIKVPDI